VESCDASGAADYATTSKRGVGVVGGSTLQCVDDFLVEAIVCGVIILPRLSASCSSGSVRTRRVCGHSASSGEGATAMVACCHRHRGRHRCQHPANYNYLPDYPERGSSLLDEGHVAYRISSLPRACVLVRWRIPRTVCKMHCWLSAAEIVLRTEDLAFVCLGLLLL